MSTMIKKDNEDQENNKQTADTIKNIDETNKRMRFSRKKISVAGCSLRVGPTDDSVPDDVPVKQTADTIENEEGDKE